VCRVVAKGEGLQVGNFCAAAVVAAIRLARKDEFAGKTIVVVLPDRPGASYSRCFEGV